MNGFERRKQEKINNILQAAFELFSQHGTQKVKITDIAKKANVSKVSIYNYFGNKENLLREVFFDFMNKAMDQSDDLLKSPLSFSEKLKKLIMFQADYIKDVNSEFIHGFDMKDPVIQKFYEEYAQTKALPFFLKFIEQGKKEGAVNEEISTEAMLLYISAISNVLQNNMDSKIRRDIGFLFFYGIQGKPEEKK